MLIAKVTCGLERFDELGRYDEDFVGDETHQLGAWSVLEACSPEPILCVKRGQIES